MMCWCFHISYNTYTHIFVCGWVYVCLSMCVSGCVYRSVCVSVSGVCVCVLVYIYAVVYVHLCVCVGVRVDVCVYIDTAVLWCV